MQHTSICNWYKNRIYQKTKTISGGGWLDLLGIIIIHYEQTQLYIHEAMHSFVCSLKPAPRKLARPIFPSFFLHCTTLISYWALMRSHETESKQHLSSFLIDWSYIGHIWSFSHTIKQCYTICKYAYWLEIPNSKAD